MGTIVLDVKSEVASSFVGIGDSIIYVHFCIKQGNGEGAGIARVIKLVAASSHTDAMGLGFLGTDAADKICISGFLVGGDLRFGDEK
jgi:hypothetical protein